MHSEDESSSQKSPALCLQGEYVTSSDINMRIMNKQHSGHDASLILANSRRIKHNGQQLYCGTCGVVFTDRHKRCICTKKLTCKICGFTIPEFKLEKKRRFREHMLSAHQQAICFSCWNTHSLTGSCGCTSKSSCAICGSYFGNKDRLAKHLDKIHQVCYCRMCLTPYKDNQKNCDCSGSAVKCSDPENNTNNTIDTKDVVSRTGDDSQNYRQVNSHKNSEETNTIANESEPFSQDMYSPDQERILIAESSFTFACKLCGLKCLSCGRLFDHFKSKHSPSMLYQCRICHIRFKNFYRYKKHVVLHFDNDMQTMTKTACEFHKESLGKGYKSELPRLLESQFISFVNCCNPSSLDNTNDQTQVSSNEDRSFAEFEKHLDYKTLSNEDECKSKSSNEANYSESARDIATLKTITGMVGVSDDLSREKSKEYVPSIDIAITKSDEEIAASSTSVDVAELSDDLMKPTESTDNGTTGRAENPKHSILEEGKSSNVNETEHGVSPEDVPADIAKYMHISWNQKEITMLPKLFYTQSKDQVGVQEKSESKLESTENINDDNQKKEAKSVEVERKCSQCGVICHRATDFTRHMRTHYKELTKCRFCSYTNKNKGIVNRHEMNQHGPEKYPCELCHKKYRSSALLRRHHKLSHGVLKCEFCNVTVAGKKLLRDHIQANHWKGRKKTQVQTKTVDLTNQGFTSPPSFVTKSRKTSEEESLPRQGRQKIAVADSKVKIGRVKARNKKEVKTRITKPTQPENVAFVASLRKPDGTCDLCLVLNPSATLSNVAVSDGSNMQAKQMIKDSVTIKTNESAQEALSSQTYVVAPGNVCYDKTNVQIPNPSYIDNNEEQSKTVPNQLFESDINKIDKMCTRESFSTEVNSEYILGDPKISPMLGNSNSDLQLQASMVSEIGPSDTNAFTQSLHTNVADVYVHNETVTSEMDVIEFYIEGTEEVVNIHDISVGDSQPGGLHDEIVTNSGYSETHLIGNQENYIVKNACTTFTPTLNDTQFDFVNDGTEPMELSVETLPENSTSENMYMCGACEEMFGSIEEVGQHVCLQNVDQVDQL